MRGPQTLTAARLRSLLDYDPLLGWLTWRVKPSPQVEIGCLAGTLRSDGYLGVQIDGVLYLAQHLAWKHLYGQWPKQTIDHKNGVRWDNSAGNLRDVTLSVNQQNRQVLPSNNTSGHLGVSWDRSRCLWEARIKVGKRRLNLGRFKDVGAAVAARSAGERRHYPQKGA
jgi:hypothetical protein